MLETGVIKPNTTHSKLPQRLCASYLTDEYFGSYRPEGILFKTEERPSYCSPVDLMALTTGKSFTSSDYHCTFIEGSEKLVYDSVDEMLKANQSKENVLKQLNTLRKDSKLSKIKNAFNYNECCFEDEVNIVPVGLVGTSQELMEKAKKYHLPIYATTQDYVHLNLKENNKFSILDF